jgi:methionyl-tRNA formyltransferase
MKYVFFGTPEFAATVLEKLIHAGLPPVAVVCNPDRPVGRKKLVTPPPTKVLAESHHDLGIRVLQPENLRNFDGALKELEPEFCIVAAYGKIIPPSILAVPPRGTIGVHPSLLPKYRGASPIQTAILNGDPVTGVTLFLVDAKLDHGEILSVAEQPLRGTETYIELERILAELGADLCVKTLPTFLAGKLTGVEQNEAAATPTKKFETQDGFIEWDYVRAARAGSAPEMAAIVDRRIRALNPDPGTWTLEQPGNARMKLLEAKLVDGRLTLMTIQYAGEKPKPAL